MIRVSKIKLNEIHEARRLLRYTWIDAYGNFFSKDAVKKITTVWHSKKNLALQAKNPEFFLLSQKQKKGK